MPFYLLIELLHREAKLSALQIRLVSEKKLKRIQGKNYRSLQSKIFDHWENYLENRTSAQQILMACRHLNGLVRSKMNSFFCHLTVHFKFKIQCLFSFIEVYKCRLFLKFLAPHYDVV